jgi:hypothetical protein
MWFGAVGGNIFERDSSLMKKLEKKIEEFFGEKVVV